MPEIVKCNDGTTRMKIDGEIYPIRNPVDPTDIIYVPVKQLDDKFANANDDDDDESTSISLEKPDGTKPSDESEELTTSQTTSYSYITYRGGYANKLPKDTSNKDIKDCIMSHLSRLRIIDDHRLRILDRTNILDDLTPRDTLETVNNFLKSINTPKLNNENEAWAKIDAWIYTNFPEETQSTDVCEACNDDCEHYDPANEITDKLESACNQNSEATVRDIFAQISKSNDKILEQVIPTFIKVIDRQMQNIDITIHKDMCNDIVNKYGNTAQVPDIKVDKEGNLIAAIIEVRLGDVYDALPYELTEPHNEHGGDLPTYSSFVYFVATLHMAITTAINDHYPTMDMKFSFEANDGTTINIMNKVVCENLGNRDLREMSVLSIKISKLTQNSEHDKQLFLRVLKDRTMYYVNNRNYTRLTPDLKNIYYKIPLIVLTNNDEAALQKDDVCKLLNPAYDTLLDSTNYYNGYLYKFLKKNYHEVFEFFMQYNVYTYIMCDSYDTYYLSVEPKPRWYSYITQPALREKIRNKKKHQCYDIDN